MFGRNSDTEVYLSPPVNGVITLRGQPVGGAYVYRTLEYDQEYIEETSTDKNGAFRFSEKKIRSVSPAKLMDETRVRQVIGLIYEDKKYLLWYHTPGGITERSAITQRLGSLRCDLAIPEKELLFRNLDKPEFPHAAFSICRWNDGLEMESLEGLE